MQTNILDPETLGTLLNVNGQLLALYQADMLEAPIIPSGWREYSLLLRFPEWWAYTNGLTVTIQTDYHWYWPPEPDAQQPPLAGLELSPAFWRGILDGFGRLAWHIKGTARARTGFQRWKYPKVALTAPQFVVARLRAFLETRGPLGQEIAARWPKPATLSVRETMGGNIEFQELRWSATDAQALAGILYRDAVIGRYREMAYEFSAWRPQSGNESIDRALADSDS